MVGPYIVSRIVSRVVSRVSLSKGETVALL